MADATQRAQRTLALLMLAAICVVGGGAALAAHVSPVIADHTARTLVAHRDQNGLLMYANGYIDAGDQVLVEQLETADHSRGGVYFIGDSQSHTAIMPYRLSPGERRMIHNYSIGGLGHRDLYFYVRNLIEEHDLLAPGPEKVTIFLGVSYHMMEDKDYAACNFVCGLFQRHGFYTYDGEEGIHRVRMNAVERWLRLRRIEANNFLRILFDPPPIARGLSREEQTPDFEPLPETWRADMANEVADLAALLDYLEQRNVRVRVIFRPSGSWINPEYQGAYRAMVEPLLAAHHIPLIDQTRLLPDDEMGDYVHPRYSGQAIVHEADRRLALEALDEMGLAVEAP